MARRHVARRPRSADSPGRAGHRPVRCRLPAGSSASRPACRTSTTPTRTATSSRARSGCSATRRTRTTSSTRPRSRTSSTRSSPCAGGRTRRRSAARSRPTRRPRSRSPAPRRAFLGALAVSLTAIAGARLFDDRRVGLLAGALLAVAFLPSHYSHFALNDAPTLAPLAAALIGDRRHLPHRPHARVRARRASASGVAIATKYTAGIVLVTLIAAAFASPVAHARVRNLVLAIALMCAGFVAANPYALLDHTGVPRRPGEADRDRGRGRRQARAGQHERAGRYYLTTFTWGLGWLPSLFALGGAGGAVRAPPAARAAARARADPAVPLPRPAVALLRALDAADLPDPLPARGLRRDRARDAACGALRVTLAIPALALSALVLLQGLVFSVHNDLVLAKADTRRWRATGWSQNIPSGTKIVVEPIAPDQWAMDAGHPIFEDQGGTGSGNRWNKWRTSRSCFFNGKQITSGACPVVKIEDYERTTRPELVELLREAAASASSSTGSTQYGRAYADPQEVPERAALLRRAQAPRRGRLPLQPVRQGLRDVPFSFDYSFNYYPLTYERPGTGDRDLPARWGTMRVMKRVVAARGRLRAARGRRAEPDRLARRAHARDQGRRRRSRTPRPRSCSARRYARRARRAHARGPHRRPPPSSTRPAASTSCCSPATTAASSYDEVGTMRRILLAQGIPAEDIFTDHAGFDTWDCAQRAQARLRRLAARSSSPRASTWPARSTTPAAPG